jgi:hypothetical protein
VPTLSTVIQGASRQSLPEVMPARHAVGAHMADEIHIIAIDDGDVLTDD